MLIKNGQVALPGLDEPKIIDVKIEGGKIADIGENLSGDSDIIDASGMYVLPGGIDPHTHFDDPGYTQREDFYHGSCAAASGGITTIIDMPCTSIPPVTDIENLRKKLSAVERKSVIDFGFFGGVSALSLQQNFFENFKKLANYVFGIKTYFISGMDTFPRLNHYQFKKVLEAAKILKIPVLLHAEDFDYVSSATQEMMKRGDSPRDYYLSRPEIAEILAVQNAVEIARLVGADLHIVHITTGKAVEIVKSGPATCETAPHYLAFTLDDFEKIGSPLKVTPPVKTADNREKLWKLLAQGKIDFVASDHAPAPEEEKFSGSIWTDYSGIPGTATLLPFLFSEGLFKKRISFKKLVQIVSENAAKRYGFFGRKGSIEIGKDADLTIIDPEAHWTVKGEKLLSKGKITPFEGMTFSGKIVKTIVRGKVVYDSSAGIVADAGYGKFLSPSN
ncbi:allantoinase AllB [bacterium]|nr:allantoinase AllB [bacterium]